MLPLPRRHACLAGPPANTCPRNKPSKQTATTPPHKTKKRINTRLPRRRAGSRRSSGVTAPNERSLACERIPLRHRSNLQRKKQKPTPLVPSTPVVARRRMTTPVVNTRPTPEQPPKKKTKTNPPRAIHSRGGTAPHDHSCGQHTPDTGATPKEKNNIVIPEFSAWLTLVLEQCRAENIRNLPRQRAPTPLFPERRPREACSMPISGCHDLPLATFNLPSRNNLQNKPNSAATMSLPCSRFATAQPQRRWDAPPGDGDSGYF